MATTNSPHPVFHWLISTLAKGFETTTLHIRTDPLLDNLREGVVLNQLKSGHREGIKITFDPELQSILFDCVCLAQAKDLAEAIRGSRKKNRVTICVPNEFYTVIDGETLLPVPTDKTTH
jgi:hypothetical protein